MSTQEPFNRIVIGDTNLTPYRDALIKFRQAGWEVAAFGNVKELIKDLTERPARLVLTNLILAQGSGFHVLDAVRKLPSLKQTKVLVVSNLSTKDNIQESISRGAVDFIIIPFPPDKLYKRLVYHLQTKKAFAVDTQQAIAAADTKSSPNEAQQSWQGQKFLATVMECLNLVANGADLQKTLYQFTKQFERVVPVNRVSCITAEWGSTTAHVLASNDDPNLTNLAIDLNNYPEVSHVLNTGLIVVVDDITKNPLTQAIQEKVKTIQIASIMVLPIRVNGVNVGAFSLRSQQAECPFTLPIAQFCQAICTSAGPVVQGLATKLTQGTPNDATTPPTDQKKPAA